MITGKEAVVESNSNIADTAFDAAEGEEELADGIGKAAKAAKGKLLNAVWHRDWEIIFKASKIYAKQRRKKSDDNTK